MNGPTRSSSRRAFKLTSSHDLTESGLVPVPPNMLDQRGYYSDIVAKENTLSENVSKINNVKFFFFFFKH